MKQQLDYLVFLFLNFCKEFSQPTLQLAPVEVKPSREKNPSPFGKKYF